MGDNPDADLLLLKNVIHENLKIVENEVFRSPLLLLSFISSGRLAHRLCSLSPGFITIKS